MEPITSADAPGVIGPYSQAVRAGDFVFLSGQVGLDPTSGVLVDGGITAETHQVLRNLGAVLRAAGASYTHVVRTTVYLADMAEFPAMNAVYSEYFVAPFPARSTVAVARLPREGRVEIDVVALL